MRNERRTSGSEGGHGKPAAATPHGAHDLPYYALEDNGTHGTTTRLPEMQEAWYQFLEYGRFVQVCDGPCDLD